MKIALYGMPCAGKSTLMDRITDAKVTNGSQELRRICGGSFLELSEEEKHQVRIKYTEYINGLNDEVIVSDGHYSFMETVAFTEADGELYDIFIYLYCSPENLKERYALSEKNGKFGYIIIVFFLLSILLFGIFKMVPGDPARLMVEGQKQSVSPEQYEMLYQQARVRLGLDKPIPVQYLSWMGNILQGDFGYSTVYRIPVKELIGPPMKNTIALNVVYYIFLFAIGIPLGIKCAVKKDTVFDTSLQVATMIGISIPSFISALIFIYLFAIKIPIFPISGMVTTGANFTGFRAFLDYLYHMALPIIVCLTGIGGLIRYVRGALLDALSMDYVRTARAKGLKEKTVIYKHAFRNAMIPITGWIVGSIVGIFGGAVIIETLFSWKGVGKLLIDSLNQHDYTVALSMQMFYILLGLAANLITDLCYCIVDPRIKLD